MTILRLSILVAMARNRVIGQNNQLPWHLPADLKHFKLLTMGKPIVMGRKTYESIGRPLPGRTNIVITHQTNYQAPGAIVVNSVADALQICKNTNMINNESFMIGGENLFQQTLEICQRMYITEIQKDFDGDTFFPALNREDWKEVSRRHHPADERHKFAFDFVRYDKK